MGIEKTTQPQRLTNANTVIGADNVPFNNAALSVYGNIESNSGIKGSSLSAGAGGITVNNGGAVNLGGGNITNAGTVTVNNGLTVNNGGLTVQSGNINVANGTVQATSVNATNITVSNAITNTNNTPFIAPQDLLPGAGAQDGSLLRYDGTTGKWQPYKLYSTGIGKEHKIYYTVDQNDPIRTTPTIPALTAINFRGTVYNPATITGIIPWRKVPKLVYAADDTHEQKLAKFQAAKSQMYAAQTLYKTIKLIPNGMTSLSENGTGDPANANLNYSPTISIQGVRADGTIRGRLGNVRVTDTNVVTGCIGGTPDPNTGMVTGGTIVPLVSAVKTGTVYRHGPTADNDTVDDVMQKPASNGNFTNFHSTGTSIRTTGPQDLGVSILSAGNFRQMHPECGGNQNNATGGTGTWDIENETWWKYSIPHYATPFWLTNTMVVANGVQAYITLEYVFTDLIHGQNYLSAQDVGTVQHYFTYTIEMSMWGVDPRYSKHVGELRVYDDLFNPNVSYNIVFYPPKQPAATLAANNAIPNQLFECAYLVQY